MPCGWVGVRVTVYLPWLLYRFLRGTKQWLARGKRRPSTGGVPRTLTGDRHIEWSWVAAAMPPGPGEALDLGCGADSYLGLIAARRGFRVVAVDLQTVRWSYDHPALTFMQGDILDLSLPHHHFDLVINCSSVEHIGLTGRYGVVRRRDDGDLEVMAWLRRLMKPQGLMLLTIPVGRDSVFEPFHRVYGKGRLPRLLEGYVAELEEYWLKDAVNRWVTTSKSAALAEEPGPSIFALGCFVLRPRTDAR